MKTSHVVATLLLAGAISAVISVYLDPKVNEQTPIQPAADTSPSVAALAVDTPNTANTARRTTTIRLRADGHYWTRALVNRKASVDFMVDTGASVVALTYADAQKMGLRPDTLNYRWEIRTAGGVTKGASVRIDSIQIDQVHVKDVDAMVLRNDLDQSLLGMSFLRELYSYEFRGDRMIIKQ
jgi:aspartyl protease family protein